ncbi:hypothetical protein Taro_054618 [Colocasia esculenta]|uniref:Uncharacterized protein n=1 Tax=Colocasia esculenta TaxID=4460 RepID=A0A843XRQ9_COLES|nr:hypothetical protein [Colocasia esculenta]
MFRELLCLGGCMLRCCFRFVFDSACPAGVMFGLTLVVGRCITLFRCIVVLCSRVVLLPPLLEFLLLWLGTIGAGVRCRTVVVVASSPCIASSVSCEREHLYRELRVAFLQVIGLFEFIAFLTGLNSNPSESSDPWVAARPLGSLAGVREGLPPRLRWLSQRQIESHHLAVEEVAQPARHQPCWISG